MYRIFFFLFFSIETILASYSIKLDKLQDHIELHLMAKDSFVLQSIESLPRGAIFNIKGSFSNASEKLLQAPVHSPYLKNYIFQQVTEKVYQIILNGVTYPDGVFSHFSIDSLYKLDIFIFPQKALSTSPLALYLQGLKAEKKGDFQLALNLYRKAIKLGGKYGNAYYRAGIIRLKKNQLRYARINFTNALKQNTDSLRVYWYMGKTYQMLGQEKLAQKYFHQYNSIIGVWNKIRQQNKQNMTQSKIPQGKKVPESSSTMTPLFLIVLGGVALLFAVILLWVYKNKKALEVEELSKGEEEETAPEDLSEREKEFLQMLQGKKEEIENAENQIISENVQKLKQKIENSELVEEEPSEREKENIKKAKELNLGVGELDLALNLKAKMRNKNKLTSQEDLILEMYREGYKKEEIAKKLQLNYGEVDLVIELNKHRFKKTH